MPCTIGLSVVGYASKVVWQLPHPLALELVRLVAVFKICLQFDVLFFVSFSLLFI